MANNNLDEIASQLDSLSIATSYECEPTQCKELIKNMKPTSKVIHLNIRSINKNIDEFRLLLSRIQISCDFIVLTECWLKNITAVPSIPGYTSHITKRITSQNDGIVVYVKNGIQTIVYEPLFEDANCMVCKVGNEMAIVSIYRSPSQQNISNFLSSLNEILTGLNYFNNIILVGDININITVNNQDVNSHEYLNLTASHGLLPAHTLPTRDQNCLDHFILKTNRSAAVLVLDTYITDHRPIFLAIEHKTKCATPKSTTKHVDISAIISEINMTDFYDILKLTDANTAADLLVLKLNHITAKHTREIKLPRKNRSIKPWITSGLLRCIRNRDRLHIKCKQNPDNYVLRISYKRYRNFCNRLLRKHKTEYERNEFLKAKNNPKATWSIIKTITNTYCCSTPPVELLKIAPTSRQSINLVNGFFASIGSNLASKIQAVPALSNLYHNHNNNISNTVSSQCNSFVLLETDAAEVERTILSLRADCATGWDGIPARILIACRNALVSPIMHICNISISSGVFPNGFKKAIVHPIYKNGDRDSVNNYRPISILTSLSKILEKIINNRLINYLESQNILSNNQFGFRKNRSTEDAISTLVNFIAAKLDGKERCLGIFLDLSKAFDTVSIPILLLKLERLGIRGPAFEILKDYLSNRTQYVKIDNITSDEETISFGVPQGSILGPTLFIVYLNDLCQLKIPHCRIVTYADDTALLIDANDWQECRVRAEYALSAVTSWLNHNLLTLNISKTQYITFSTNQISQPKPNFTIKAHVCQPLKLAHNTKCHCLSLVKTSNIKYLGMKIDEKLNWQDQIDQLVSRVRRLIYVFKSIRHSASTDTLKLVYSALCESLLTYCNTIWGGANKTSFLLLERAQRAVLKVMFKKPFRYPTTQLYIDSKVLTVRQLYVYRTVLRKHLSLPFDPNIKTKRRWKDRIYLIATHRTQFLARQYPVLSSRLYNITNKNIDIYDLTKYKCKTKIRQWLLQLTYNDTELLLTTST